MYTNNIIHSSNLTLQIGATDDTTTSNISTISNDQFRKDALNFLFTADATILFGDLTNYFKIPRMITNLITFLQSLHLQQDQP